MYIHKNICSIILILLSSYLKNNREDLSTLQREEIQKQKKPPLPEKGVDQNNQSRLQT